MHNVILSPIDPDTLIEKIAIRATEAVLRVNAENLKQGGKETLLSPEEAERFLKITKSTLRRLRKQGKIKMYGLGGSRYYKQSELIDSLIEIND